MFIQEMIDAQFKRIEELQKQFDDPTVGQDDVKLTDALRTERAQTLRKTIQSLERQRTDTVARFDTEIASVKDRIAALEKPSDLNFARQTSGNARARKATRASSAPKKPRAKPAGKKKR